MEGTKHVPPNGGLALFVLVVYFVVSFVPVAQAHTDFESSEPAAGAVVESAVYEIKLRFIASPPHRRITSSPHRLTASQSTYPAVFASLCAHGLDVAELVAAM